MKQFNNLREETLLEKLKANDPTGKWIHDFVHSDNPKFAGKSKKERIRMALGAAYASKKNEEVEHIDEDMKSAAAELSKYAKGYGGIDKADFQTAAKHMSAGNHKALHNHIKKLDTDPRDKILTTLHKHGNDIKRYGYATEAVEELEERIVTPGTGTSSDPLTARTGILRSIKTGDNVNRAKSQLKTAIKSTVQNKEHGKSNLPEEVEQIDEISGELAQRYHDKAVKAPTPSNKKDPIKHVLNRFSSMQRAQDRIHKSELNRMSNDFQSKLKTEGENKQMKGKDPCWSGYQMVGTKNKGGKEVPNCVPVKK